MSQLVGPVQILRDVQNRVEQCLAGSMSPAAALETYTSTRAKLEAVRKQIHEMGDGTAAGQLKIVELSHQTLGLMIGAVSRTPPDAAVKKKPLVIPSQWTRVRDEIAAAILPFSLDVVGICAEYVVAKSETFDVKAWNEQRVDVGPPRELTPEVIAFWNSEDPVDVAHGVEKPRKVYQTHLPPVLKPGSITYEEQTEIYDVVALARIDPNLFKSLDAGARDQICRRPSIYPGEPVWIVQRIDVVARNGTSDECEREIVKINERTRAGYEASPSISDICTVIWARNKMTGERHLGDNTGAEQRWTYTRTPLRARIPSFNFSGGHHIWMIGGLDQEGRLHAEAIRHALKPGHHYGIVLQRIFKA